MKKPLRTLISVMLILITLCTLFIFTSFSASPAIGDADNSGGKPTIADARRILRTAADIEPADNLTVFDVNADGTINVDDARSVLRVASNLAVDGLTVSAEGYIMPHGGWSYDDYDVGRCSPVEYILYSCAPPSETTSTTAPITSTTTTSFNVTTLPSVATTVTTAPSSTVVTTTATGDIDKNGLYTTKADVSLYIHTYGCLPSNFITKSQAQALGWPGGDLDPYAYGKCIGGDYFGNYEGLLPDKQGRTYHECDINTLHKNSRGAERLVYSNDGLIYYTADHYASFTLLYGAS